MPPPSPCPLPAPLPGQVSSDPHIYIAGSVPPRAQPGSWVGGDRGREKNGHTLVCPGPVLLLPLGAGFGFDGGEAGRTKENIWEISISCPALRLPILLSPEQGRRTEEPLNGSQQADQGGLAAVGSRHMLGAGRLGSSSVGDFFSLGH